MSPMTERVELRLDTDTLTSIDSWRANQPGAPSRSDAIRQLVERGLGKHELRFSKGETLIMWMLADLLKAGKVKGDIRTDFVINALSGGHLWALEMEMPGVFHDDIDSSNTWKSVVRWLEMWDFVENSIEHFSATDLKKLEVALDSAPDTHKFWGFDGNYESEYMSVAQFLVRDMKRFSRFAKRDMNSHSRRVGYYTRMYDVFEPMRMKMVHGRLGVNDLIKILEADA